MVPVSALPSVTSDRSAVSRPSVAGMWPVRPNPARSNATTRVGAPSRETPCHSPRGVSARQFRWPSPASAVRAASSVWQSSSCAGLPRLEAMQKRSSSMSWSSTRRKGGGMSPSKSLPARRRNTSCRRSPSALGTWPVKRFAAKFRATSSRKWPRSAGMAPCSLFRSRRRSTSWSRRPSAGGKRPPKARWPSSSARTRGGSPARRTPSHASMGREGCQLSASPGSSSSRAANSAAASASRPGPARVGRSQESPSTSRSATRRHKAGGTPGVSNVGSILRSAKRSNRDNSAGSAPSSSLPCNHRVRSASRLASAGDSRPPRPLWCRCRPTTRRGSPPRRTPRHQPRGSLRCQLSDAAPAKVSRMASNVSQSRSQPGVAALVRAQNTKWRRSLVATANNPPGGAPDRSLPARRTSCKLLKRPTARGTSPRSRLPPSRSVSSIASSPNSSGMWPVSPVLVRLRWVMRGGGPANRTPCQSAMGVTRLQFRWPLPANASRPASSAAQSWRSPGYSSPTAASHRRRS